VKSIPEHLTRVKELTGEYVKLDGQRRAAIIEAARDGATVLQLAEVSLLPPEAVARVLGEEWSPERAKEELGWRS
jgi:hypothetical protein